MAIVDKSSPEKIQIFIDTKSLQGDASVELKLLCKQKLEEKVRDIHFEMPSVKYMDSASIGTFLYIIQVLRKDSKKVYIDSASDELKQLFKSLLLDQFLSL